MCLGSFSTITQTWDPSMQQTSLKDIMEIFIPCSRESFITITSCFLLLVLSGSCQAIRDAPQDEWDSTWASHEVWRQWTYCATASHWVGQDPSSWCERSPPSGLHYNRSSDWSASWAQVVCAPLLQLEGSGSRKRSSWSLKFLVLYRVTSSHSSFTV